MEKKIKVLIADDHKLLTSGLKMEIGLWEEFEVVGIASNGSDTITLCEEHKPDIILMDMQMPVMSGAEAAAAIKKEHPDVRIIALTTFDDYETVSSAIKCGCDGFLLKIISPEQLRTSLHAIMNGVGVFDDEAMSKLRQIELSRSGTEFSERETEVLEYICKGLSNKEIAEKLSLQTGTVKNLVSIMLNKTFCISRTALARYAIDNGLVKTEKE